MGRPTLQASLGGGSGAEVSHQGLTGTSPGGDGSRRELMH